MIKYIFISLILVLFISCGSNTSTSSPNYTGYLVDSRVSGVEYTCNNISGITKEDGSFTFNYSCDEITFKLGNIILANMKISSVKTDNIFYITDITQRSNRNDTNNIPVKNITRLLQSLDDDNDPRNGINITQNIRDNIVTNIPYEIGSDKINEQDLQNIVKEADPSKTLISDTKALVHFEQVLRDNNIYVDTVPPFKPYLSNNIISTPSDITIIDIHGEQNTKIYLNGIYTNKDINKDGIYNDFELDTSHIKNTFKEFNLTLVDDTNKTSEILQLRIFKDTDDIGNKDKLPASNTTINSPEQFIYDIDITDNSTSYGLDLVYKIEGDDKDLFEIDTTNGYLSFKNPSIAGNTYNIKLTVSDLAYHSVSKDINITVN